MSNKLDREELLKKVIENHLKYIEDHLTSDNWSSQLKPNIEKTDNILTSLERIDKHLKALQTEKEAQQLKEQQFNEEIMKPWEQIQDPTPYNCGTFKTLDSLINTVLNPRANDIAIVDGEDYFFTGEAWVKQPKDITHIEFDHE